MSAALFLDAGGLLVTQAAVQSIFVVAFVATPGDALTRWFDAVIGGAVALLAAARSSRRRRCGGRGARRRSWCGRISTLLRDAAQCTRDGDVQRAARVLASGPGHRGAAARAAAPRPTRGWRSSPRRRSSASTRRSSAASPSSSNRWTGRCAAPGCSSYGSPSTRTASRRPDVVRDAARRPCRRDRHRGPGPGGELRRGAWARAGSSRSGGPPRAWSAARCRSTSCSSRSGRSSSTCSRSPGWTTRRRSRSCRGSPNSSPLLIPAWKDGQRPRRCVDPRSLAGRRSTSPRCRGTTRRSARARPGCRGTAARQPVSARSLLESIA